MYAARKFSDKNYMQLVIGDEFIHIELNDLILEHPELKVGEPATQFEKTITNTFGSEFKLLFNVQEVDYETAHAVKHPEPAKDDENDQKNVEKEAE